MQHTFETLVRPRDADLHARFLDRNSELHRFTASQDHCHQWLDADFFKLFSGYAISAGCLPHAILENIICSTKWLFDGQVVGMINTLEMLFKLLTLGADCLEGASWPFTIRDVLYNFARAVRLWPRADPQCQALTRFGTPAREDCVPAPPRFDAGWKELIWRPSPLQVLRNELASVRFTIPTHAPILRPGTLRTAHYKVVALERRFAVRGLETSKKHFRERRSSCDGLRARRWPHRGRRAPWISTTFAFRAAASRRRSRTCFFVGHRPCRRGDSCNSVSVSTPTAVTKVRFQATSSALRERQNEQTKCCRSQRTEAHEVLKQRRSISKARMDS